MTTWPIIRTKPGGRSYGLAIPAFIHNGSYHVVTVNAYADGAVDAWGFLDLDLFRQKVKRGWVVSEAPVGATASIFNLGDFVVGEATWTSSQAEVVERVEAAVRHLNPAGQGLLDMQGTDVELRNGLRYAKLGLSDKKPYSRGEDGGDVLGAEMPLFLRAGDGFVFTRWFIYADGLTRFGAEGRLMPLDEAADRLRGRGDVALTVPEGAWVEFEGLGCVRAKAFSSYVKPKERVKEARDLLEELRGGPNSVMTCAKVFKVYEKDPSDENRESLRRAYEAVPKHLRIYCGDMDTKDGEIRRALSSKRG